MQAKEKYNNIIYKIEELVSNAEYMRDREISNKAFEAANWGINDRDKNTIFIFLMGRSVLDYITERRMMASYQYIISSEKPVYEKAISLSGVQNQPSFNKKFKKQFGITPRQAFVEKDESRIEPIKNWDFISQERQQLLVELDKNENALREKKFGISKEMYIRAQQAESLQSFYKLNDLEAEFAFNLSENQPVTIEESFEYVYNYVWGYVEEIFANEGNVEKRDERIEEDLLNDDTLYLYFECGLSFNDICSLFSIQYCLRMEKQLRQYDSSYLNGCVQYLNGELLSYQLGFISKEDLVLSYEKYQKAYQYYMNKKTEEYTEFDYLLYIRLLKEYGVIATAWARLKPGKRSLHQVQIAYENTRDYFLQQKSPDYDYIQPERNFGLYEQIDYEGFYEDDVMYDIDDYECIQESYMSFDFEPTEMETYYDEEYFEMPCELEEDDELIVEKYNGRGLLYRMDLNVSEEFEKKSTFTWHERNDK